jgi:L,D-transpeptidase ErfK/SrfK
MPVRASIVGVDQLHEVQEGENLYTIALHYGLAVEHLAYANAMEKVQLYVEPGLELRIPLRRIMPDNPPRDGIVVNLPELGLYLFRSGHLHRFYPIAFGEPGRFATPCGQFHILSKATDPTWTPPHWAGIEEPVVKPGPLNPLGDRWIGVTASGVGIHSTNTPLYIGQAISHSCIRLYPSMIHELYPLTWVGMPVRIEYETVRLAKGDDGKHYIAVFPDVYHKSDPALTARRLLRQAGIRHYDAALVDRLSARPDGVVTCVEPETQRPGG